MKKESLVDEAALRRAAEKTGGNLTEEFLDQVQNEVSNMLANFVKQQKNRSRVLKIDEEKESSPASGVLSDEQLRELPRWVKDNLDSAVVVGKSGQVIRVTDGRKYHLNNRLNDLSGGEWTFFLNSVINTRYPTTGPESFAHHIRKVHPSPKPPQLMKAIIEFFTKEDELVFDYFMGVGGTLLGASLSGRRAIGVDLSPNYVDAYRRASRELGLKEQMSFVGDSLEMLRSQPQMKALLNDEEVSLIAIDPPYGDMMSREKTGEAAKRKLDTSPTPFTHEETDLGNLPVKEFFRRLRESVELSLAYLKNKGHLVIFIKDLQPERGETNLLHAELIDTISSISELQYLGMKIWADQSVNLYPYGYPYAFVSNQIHQYIVIFRKMGS